MDAKTVPKAAQRMKALIDKDPAWKRAEAAEARLRKRGMKQMRDLAAMQARSGPSVMMNLTGPFIGVRPRTPVAHQYSSAADGVPGGYLQFHTFGGVTGPGSSVSYFPSLGMQYDDDAILLSGAPVAESQASDDLTAEPSHGRTSHAALWGWIQGAPPGSQYLLVVYVGNGSLHDSTVPKAQFLVSGTNVRVESIPGDEQVALLIDGTGDNTDYLDIKVRLVSDTNTGGLLFRGADITIL